MSQGRTAARRAVLDTAGVRSMSGYFSLETGGPLGQGCLGPAEIDELHVWSDLHAVIQPGPGHGALPPRAVLVTSLSPSSPLVLLNASMGDEAFLTRRDCGCPLQALGWTTHVHTIRSFEKLTGISVAYSEVGILQVQAKAMSEAVARSGSFDFWIGDPISLPDLVEAGLASPGRSAARGAGVIDRFRGRVLFPIRIDRLEGLLLPGQRIVKA